MSSDDDGQLAKVDNAARSLLLQDTVDVVIAPRAEFLRTLQNVMTIER